MSEPGYVVGGKVYPFVSNLVFGDAPLVRKVTGLDFEDWAARVDSGEPDTLAVIGLVAVAVSRHEGWADDKVAAFVRSLDFEGFDVVAPEGDAGPPAVTEEGSPTSSGESTISAELSQEGAPV